MDAQTPSAESENTMLASLATGNGFGSTWNPLPPGEYAPNRPGGGAVPIGNVAAEVSNYRGNKFTRGWLAGDGGAHVEQALGSLAQPIRPAPYNCRLWSDFRAVVPEYGAPVAGLANWDTAAPGRQTAAENSVNARAEFIPSTYDSRLNGLDPVSGYVGPRVFTADQAIIKTPTDQFNAYAQVPEGGQAPPISVGSDGIPFGAKASANAWRGASSRFAPRGRVGAV